MFRLLKNKFQKIKKIRKTRKKILNELKTVLPDGEIYSWKKFATKSSKLGLVTFGNNIQYFNNGTDFIKMQWDSIKKATSSVIFEMYTLQPDNVGNQTINLLAKASRRGVEVSVLLDHFGSIELSKSHLEKLLKADVKVMLYNRITLRNMISIIIKLDFMKFNNFYFRNHRKCVLIDHKTAFLGSSNHGEDYVGSDLKGNGRFRDSNCVIEGPAISSLLSEYGNTLKQFKVKRFPNPFSKIKNFVMKTILKFRGNRKSLNENKTISKNGFKSKSLQIQFSSGRNRRKITSCLISAINSSRKFIYITNPYFLPPIPLFRAILDAVSRGIKVRILTTGSSDVMGVKQATFVYLRQLIKAGAKVYVMKKKILHAKTIVIDDFYSSLGSFNFDDWSVHRNLETNVASISKVNAEILRSHFERDIIESKEIFLDDIKAKGISEWIISYLCYFFTKVPRLTEYINIYEIKNK